MRILLSLILFALLIPLGYAENIVEDAGLQPCRNLKGLERAECRSLQELKNAGEFIPKLSAGGLSCIPAQTLSAAQREWCLLKESIEKKRHPQEKEISRSMQRAELRSVKSRGVRGDFAREAKKQRELYETLIQDQLRGRQSNLDRAETFDKHTRIRQENRGAGVQEKSDRVLDVHGKNTFQRGKLRYVRTRPIR